MMVPYSTFIEQVKALGCVKMLKEINTYGTNWELPCLYAINKHKQLVGSYSPQWGGKVYPKGLQLWSTKGRKFDEVSF